MTMNEYGWEDDEEQPRLPPPNDGRLTEPFFVRMTPERRARW
jgi:hypothetical protein